MKFLVLFGQNKEVANSPSLNNVLEIIRHFERKQSIDGLIRMAKKSEYREIRFISIYESQR